METQEPRGQRVLDGAGSVDTAVVPAAGVGSRIRELTRYTSKELLPLGSTVVLNWVLAELASCGIRRVLVVSRPDKNDLNRFVSSRRAASTFSIETELVFQGDERGSGGALLSTRQIVGDAPFVVVWGDEVFRGESRMGKCLEEFRKLPVSVICAKTVSDADVEKCGIIEGRAAGARLTRVHEIIEKPPLARTRSRLASLGGFVLTGSIFDALDERDRSSDAEIYLSDALSRLAQYSEVLAVHVDSEWYETGSYVGYLNALRAFGGESPSTDLLGRQGRLDPSEVD